MIIRNKEIRYEKGIFAGIPTDILKAFDYISHDLLLAKLDTYGFDQQAVTFISAYLNNRNH